MNDADRIRAAQLAAILLGCAQTLVLARRFWMQRSLFVGCALWLALGTVACTRSEPFRDTEGPDVNGFDATAPCVWDAPPIPPYDAGEAGYPLYGNAAQPGNDGRFIFLYQSGDLFDFPFAPILVGSHETFDALINSPTLSSDVAVPPLAGTSSNSSALQLTGVHVLRDCCNQDAGAGCVTLPDTAGCSDCDGTIESSVSLDVRAAATGDTTLTLRTSDGAEYEAIAVSVRSASRLEPNLYDPQTSSSRPITSVVVAVGQTVRIRTIAFDANGTQLEGRYGVTCTVSDPTVCGVREPGFVLGSAPTYAASVDSYDVEVKGLAAGQTTLTITANNATATVLVLTQ